MKRDLELKLHKKLKEKGILWPHVTNDFADKFDVEFLRHPNMFSKDSLPPVEGRVVFTVLVDDERGNPHHGFSIPEEVALKMLTLGIP